MALNSALARGSALNITSPWRGILPFPDGTVSQADRPVVPFMYGGLVVVPVITPSEAFAPGGTKARKKIRGPYSDPRIYEAYIARCIAERQKPRVNIEVALLKEALVDEVEERRQTEYDEYDTLVRENQLLERLLAFERTKRNLAAIAARQHQIAVQIEELMEREAQSIIMLLDEM